MIRRERDGRSGTGAHPISSLPRTWDRISGSFLFGSGPGLDGGERAARARRPPAAKLALWASLLLVTAASVALSQVVAEAQIVAEDDAYGVPFGADLMVEAPGVLDNDSLNGMPAADGGVTAELASGAGEGVLSCPSNPGVELCPDGSFTYTPGAPFGGTDTFTYRAVAGAASALATVTLTACTGGPARVTCWKEAPFLARVQELGYDTFQEGFEDVATWGGVRFPATAPSVASQGIVWQTNHPDPPASNEITTGSGAAVTGSWGVYDPHHGYATGTPAECDVDVPPPGCLFKDGWTGVSEAGPAGQATLYAVGGYFTGSFGPKLVLILDGGAPIGLGLVPVGEAQFFGVVDSAGFTTFRVEETDGKVGQVRLVFGDDFTIATVALPIFTDGFESGNLSAWSSSFPSPPP